MVNWNSANDRLLLLLALKQLNGALDYGILAKEFGQEVGQDVTVNVMRIRISQLKRLDRETGTVTKVKSGRVAKNLKSMNGGKSAIKEEHVKEEENCYDLSTIEVKMEKKEDE